MLLFVLRFNIFSNLCKNHKPRQLFIYFNFYSCQFNFRILQTNSLLTCFYIYLFLILAVGFSFLAVADGVRRLLQPVKGWRRESLQLLLLQLFPRSGATGVPIAPFYLKSFYYGEFKSHRMIWVFCNFVIAFFIFHCIIQEKIHKFTLKIFSH